MASWKQCQFNERLLDLFMENLALDPTWVKNHACYDETQSLRRYRRLIFVRTIVRNLIGNFTLFFAAPYTI